eukprot:scaffold1.g5463.t1
MHQAAAGTSGASNAAAEPASPCQLVRDSAAWVAARASLVTISDTAVEAAAVALPPPRLAALARGAAAFDTDLHFVDLLRPELTAMALLVVDALNFCFWPEEGLEYERLARGVKAAVLADPHAVDAERLAAADAALVRRLFGGWPRAVPLEEERTRLLREVGAGLLADWGGQAAQLVRAAGGSAARLVGLVAAAFPGFRDHCAWQGRQLFFYKRAQIFAADLFGAFSGAGLGQFSDVARLTMFADYRVPVEQAPGSREEVEIRACTVEAVERLRVAIEARLRREARRAEQAARQGGGEDEGAWQAGRAAGREEGAEPLSCTPEVLSLAVDWWLWEEGERNIARHRPHHRIRTVYY